jgi:conjugative transfer pilus assembly protein TraH
MKKKFKKVLPALIGLAMLTTSLTSRAGLQDALDGMFMSNATSPAAFESQTRGGFVGGGLGVRAPIRSINLVAFDPPRFNAGCGGIDIFGGSFSFINADQIVALFRQIAANSIGLAFKAAIDAINPQLGNLMQNFQSAMQSLNENMKNTCAVANQIVKSFSDPNARAEMAQAGAAAGEAAVGAFSDLMGGITQLFTSPKTVVASANEDNTCPDCGNPVWKALTDSNPGQLLGNPSTSQTDPASDNEVIMSLIGSVVISPADKNETDGQGKPSADPGSERAPTLTITQLRDGNTNGRPLKVLHCADSQERNKCLNVEERDFNFPGTLGYTNLMLFGDKEGAGVSIADSIVGKITACTTQKCGFTTAQASFINSIRPQLIALMKQVQASQGAVEQVARDLAPVIADELAEKYGMAAVTAARKSWDGVKVTRPSFVPDALKLRSEELAAVRLSAEGNNKRVLDAAAMTNQIVSKNPAVFVKTSLY